MRIDCKILPNKKKKKNNNNNNNNIQISWLLKRTKLSYKEDKKENTPLSSLKIVKLKDGIPLGVVIYMLFSKYIYIRFTI